MQPTTSSAPTGFFRLANILGQCLVGAAAALSLLACGRAPQHWSYFSDVVAPEGPFSLAADADTLFFWGLVLFMGMLGVVCTRNRRAGRGRRLLALLTAGSLGLLALAVAYSPLVTSVYVEGSLGMMGICGLLALGFARMGYLCLDGRADVAAVATTS